MPFKISVLITSFLCFTMAVAAQKTRITRLGMPLLKQDEPVAIFVPEDSDFPAATAIAIGILHSVDYEPDGTPTLHQLLDIMKQHARDNGANALKIMEIKPPGFSAKCHRIVAGMFYIDSAQNYERSFEWSKDRRLRWEDFRGKPMPDSINKIPALAVCRFYLEAEPVYTTKNVHVYITNAFSYKTSWVLPDSMQVKNALAFEQLKFDLAEVYTRQCREAFARAGFTNIKNVKNADAASLIYKRAYVDFTDEWEICSTETDHGRNDLQFTAWQQKVAKQLELLHEYASPNRF